MELWKTGDLPAHYSRTSEPRPAEHKHETRHTLAAPSQTKLDGPAQRSRKQKISRALRSAILAAYRNLMLWWVVLDSNQ